MTRLYLLRHGEVTSHRGDVPITSAAERQSYEFGQTLGSSLPGPIRILSGETRRAKDTSTHLARGLADAGVEFTGPDIAFALRNPDLYVLGTRVNMVSSPEALAQQVEGLSPADVASLPFFPEFFESSDRIGWWLTHSSPPGEVASSVAERVTAFAFSLADPVPHQPDVTVAVTHSPLLRAVAQRYLSGDIGEPAWVSGLLMKIEPDSEIEVEVFEVGAR